MICMAFVGGGGADCVVSVLCGAGGGLTVHPATTNDVSNTAPTTARTRRGSVGTPFRVSGADQTVGWAALVTTEMAVDVELMT